ncbi:AfsR/SARP family transcriptional regulator [Streptomyces oceani]|uniref:OmpR/PhoB-type domain-containing protein n=1 Tax=Streptomyces oceani TaxID=1075402 RepID=A0A1E7KET4_9ACTN|nr:AfsR/SARP family transcriptional regulator [Streptomyces oceani]OEV02430.1 hypothetical protein AN216_16210 [Streptomyces oceani]
MQIDILGSVTVTVGEQTREVRAAKVRTMLATLALEARRAISCPELADELWADHEISNTANALQAHATRVRKVLDGPSRTRSASLLRSVPGGYLLDIPADRVDSHRFLQLASDGAAALTANPERARVLFESALGIWRGPALLDAGDGLRCRSAATLFEERRLTVRELLASARLALGDEARAIAELQRLVAQHPLSERFCELLMLALYRAGRQSDALYLFRSTQRRLDEELGVRPGDSLQRRYSEILTQDPALVRSDALWARHRPSGRDGLVAIR